MPNTYRILRAPLAGALALCLAAACGKTNDAPAMDSAMTTTTASPGTVAPAPALDDVDIEGLKLGRAVGADNMLTDATDDFKPNDTIYAVVETDANEAGKPIVARWTFGADNQLVSEETQTVAAGENARTVFKVSKPSGWPKGEYHLRLMYNGREVKSADFEVK